MTKSYKLCYGLISVGVLLCAAYPIYMAVSVISDMVQFGTVAREHYPKYIIPYAPAAAGLIVAVLIMPLFRKLSYGKASLCGALIGTSVFFAAEFYLESQVIVSGQYELEHWQMSACYISPTQTMTRTWTPVDILMGEYSPTFKLHFYLISVVLVIAFVRVLYGFGYRILHDRTATVRVLVTQTVSTVFLLGLCLLACFTAFFRDGELTVSPISAVLMAVFFIALGATAGLFVASFFTRKRGLLAVGVPALIASATTLLMYVGETFLLSGHLYRFGTGWFFEPIGSIALAAVDVLVILVTGILTAVITRYWAK